MRGVGKSVDSNWPKLFLYSASTLDGKGGPPQKAAATNVENKFLAFRRTVAVGAGEWFLFGIGEMVSG
jgi:hypothetical protein